MSNVAWPANETMTIAESGTASGHKHLQEGMSLVKFQMPSAMTGTKLTLQGSFNGSTFTTVYLDGAAVEYTFSPSVIMEVNPRATIGLRAYRFLSDASEAAARTITASALRVV